MNMIDRFVLSCNFNLLCANVLIFFNYCLLLIIIRACFTEIKRTINRISIDKLDPIIIAKNQLLIYVFNVILITMLVISHNEKLKPFIKLILILRLFNE
jgi:hypothetical protein